jgi:hypothetical protein
LENQFVCPLGCEPGLMGSSGPATRCALHQVPLIGSRPDSNLFMVNHQLSAPRHGRAVPRRAGPRAPFGSSPTPTPPRHRQAALTTIGRAISGRMCGHRRGMYTLSPILPGQECRVPTGRAVGGVARSCAGAACPMFHAVISRRIRWPDSGTPCSVLWLWPWRQAPPWPIPDTTGAFP